MAHKLAVDPKPASAGASLAYPLTPAATNRFSRTTFFIKCNPHSPSQVKIDSG